MKDVLLNPPEIGSRTANNKAVCQPIVTGQQIKRRPNNLTVFEIMISVYMQSNMMTP
jgi:hypothetical protein